MTGNLELDEAGTARLVDELRAHAADSDESAQRAEAALAAAARSVSSGPMADAMSRLAGRFRGAAEPVGTRMTSLGAAVTTAAGAIVDTDGTLAASVERRRR